MPDPGQSWKLRELQTKISTQNLLISFPIHEVDMNLGCEPSQGYYPPRSWLLHSGSDVETKTIVALFEGILSLSARAGLVAGRFFPCHRQAIVTIAVRKKTFVSGRLQSRLVAVWFQS